MSKHSYKYIKHLSSQYWLGLRVEALKAAKNKCQRCGQGARLEVHHKHYLTLGKETLADVEVLCGACHPKADEERAWISHRRQSWARVAGFARRKYGDDWEYRIDPDDAWDDFHEWLESRDGY